MCGNAEHFREQIFELLRLCRVSGSQSGGIAAKKDPTLRKAELFRKSDGEAGKKQLRTFIT